MTFGWLIAHYVMINCLTAARFCGGHIFVDNHYYMNASLIYFLHWLTIKKSVWRIVGYSLCHVVNV